MPHFLAILTILIHLQAPSLSICRTEIGFRVSGLASVGWDAMTGGGEADGDVLSALPLADGTIQVVYWWTENDQDFSDELWGNASSPRCIAAWQPSAPSILIPAPHNGVFLIEIQDAYGHWSRVTDAAHPDGIVLSPNGQYVELIGSVGQDIDPAHYRLVRIGD